MTERNEAADAHRSALLRIIRSRSSLKEISVEVLGKGDAYLHQYIHYSKPKKLPPQVRAKLAAWLRIEESLLIEPDNQDETPLANISDNGDSLNAIKMLQVFRLTEDGRVNRAQPVTEIINPFPNDGIDSDIYCIQMTTEGTFPYGTVLIISPKAGIRAGDYVWVESNESGNFPARLIASMREMVIVTENMRKSGEMVIYRNSGATVEKICGTLFP